MSRMEISRSTSTLTLFEVSVTLPEPIIRCDASVLGFTAVVKTTDTDTALNAISRAATTCAEVVDTVVDGWKVTLLFRTEKAAEAFATGLSAPDATE
jgi:hypothetical protein